MTDIPRLLQGARDGRLSVRQFLGIIHRELRRRTLDSAALLSALRDDAEGAALPPSVQRAVTEKMQDWTAAACADDVADTVVDPEGLRAVLATDAPGAGAWQPDVATARVGRLLNYRFQLIERIGSGGMSTVFKAVDRRRVEARSADPYVAVKILKLPPGEHDVALALLQREAHKLQTLAHPNIVRVLECDSDGPLVFMTMEYLSGESLKHRLQWRPRGLAREEAMRTLAGVAVALIYAHRNHIVHGDLKPANVLLTTAGLVKVIDFGVARIVFPAQQQGAAVAAPAAAAAEASIAMTPQYASPEMLTGAAPDPRDDVYALGCIVSELFSGMHPYDRRPARQARAEGLKLIHGAGLTHRQFRAIRNAVQFERERRTPSVERFLVEFGLDLSAIGERAAAIAGVRDPTRLIGLIIIGLLLLAGAVLWWFKHPSAGTRSTAATSSHQALSEQRAQRLDQQLRVRQKGLMRRVDL